MRYLKIIFLFSLFFLTSGFADQDSKPVVLYQGKITLNIPNAFRVDPEFATKEKIFFVDGTKKSAISVYYPKEREEGVNLKAELDTLANGLVQKDNIIEKKMIKIRGNDFAVFKMRGNASAGSTEMIYQMFALSVLNGRKLIIAIVLMQADYPKPEKIFDPVLNSIQLKH